MPLGQRKQAEMKPTPRSPRVGAIADALMAARDWADKAKVPEAVPLVGGQGLGSLVLGKAPEELTEMSYGNMPVRINPLAGRTASYVPEIKPGRKEQVADLALLAGTPKVGKAGLGLAGGDVGDASERAMLAAIKKAEKEQFVSEIEDSIQLTKPTKINPPADTVKAYKLFRTDNEGNLYPLFVDAKTPIPVGEWLQAKAGELTKEGKVKSSLGPLAYRPGWHAGDLPIATHIGGRYDPKTLQKTKPVKGSKPNVREDNQVWAEVEMPADVDWQTVAESRASIVKSGPNKGQINRSEAHITDQLPLGGHYRYKTNPNMTGNWLIGGEMKVNKVLSDDEVRAINKEAGVSDLPRLSDLAKEYGTQVGFARGGIVKKRIPGFQEGGANIDPVSGNEVPTGSLPEEVRDDVDAKLSPGEFVIPADVVRFIGLERLMKMRDEAKKGLQRMSDIGQMGNAEEVGEKSNSTYEENDNFENEVDDILEEIESEQGDTNEQTEKMMAQGGFLKSGTDLTKAPKNPVFDVRYYKNDQGSVMYITHINGKPMTPIPEGFKVVSQEDAQKVGQAADEAKKAATPATGAVGAGGAASGQEGTGMPSMTPAQQQQMNADIASGKQDLTMQQLNQTLTNIAGKSIPIALTKGLSGLLSPLTASLSGQALDPNEALLQESQDVNPSSPASVGGPSAAAAAQSAASAAMESGHSNTASIAAANAAAAAINNGATTEQAASIGAGAATAVDAGADTSGNIGPSVGDSVTGVDAGEGVGVYASGGLINRRQYPKKKTRGKGLAATK